MPTARCRATSRSKNGVLRSCDRLGLHGRVARHDQSPAHSLSPNETPDETGSGLCDLAEKHVAISASWSRLA